MTSHVADKKGHIQDDEQEELPEDGVDEEEGLADIDEEDNQEKEIDQEIHDSALSLQEKKDGEDL